MGAKEMLLGSDWKEKNKGEKLSKISKIADVGFVFFALLASGMAPALASTVITASVATYSAAEIYEASEKRRKNKR